jgi:membrane protease YdiL (CAAX protease family)
VLSSVVFAAFHIGWTPNGLLPVVLLFGLVCCLLYRRTGSLYPSLALHALVNSLSAATELGWAWQVPVAALLCVAGTCAVARLVGATLGEPVPPSPREKRSGPQRSQLAG